ncbi:cellulose biosynthesis regulator diguanylate cyclase DgcQ [Vagococcus sp. WN89Y]|uniref:cellulose biosynthesis regulator diguanylate cyclase DgcQ n=1 Tax=Vagococcus sp. WN89Y TaxID=3457258 RepID=UPI003FCDED53
MNKNRLSGKLKAWFEPSRVVNLCFVVVLICSTVLTWREVNVLEGAYISSQRSLLVNVSNALEKHMQVGIDRLLFFRNGMQQALQIPLGFEVFRNIKHEFERVRTQPQWQITLDARRTLPLYGVSDHFVNESGTLNRDNPLLQNELTAAMELGYLYRLSDDADMLPRRAYYVSRAGFFVATHALNGEQEIVPNYYNLLMRPWFLGQSERENPRRGVRWFTDQAHRPSEADSFITASLPLDARGYWYGVLVMSFPLTVINEVIHDAWHVADKGEYQLYDSQFTLLTSTLDAGNAEQTFSVKQRQYLQKEIARDPQGEVRLGTRFISWQKLKHFDGTLLRVHVLHDGIRDDFGRISIALLLLWLLFTTMLFLAWVVIRRMVKNMLRMQQTLQWQAWYDPLTRLCNRRSLFERARVLSEQCRSQQLPLSVIQLDLDHFKNINDRYGHQIGDLVLTMTAGVISHAIRAHDVAGRVGGEEFCVVLPNCPLAEAVEVAERIRSRLNSKEMLIKKHKTIRISASLGVSGAPEQRSYDFEHLQSVADHRLYQAKKQGRNRVCYEDDAAKN